MASQFSFSLVFGSLRRFSSKHHNHHPLQFSKLYVESTTSPKQKILEKDTLGFGKYFSDHMLSVRWTAESGWDAPHITPFQNLSLPPSATVFHYAIECFEGMKAFRGHDNKIRMFRPELNATRLLKSCTRLALPAFDKSEFLKCLEALVAKDKEWVPPGRGYSLYIRPTAISTQPTLGVGSCSSSLLFAILSPVGAYYSTGFKPVNLLADTRYVRAWTGGMGDTKCGGNYASTIKPQAEAAARNCQQVLWLFGPEQLVTEVGTMNLFVFWRNKQGETELITAPLDGTILEGVTRQSVLDLAREWKEFKVSEKYFTMPELAEALSNGQVIEMFGAGTAATVSPIASILYNDQTYKVPLAEGESGTLAKRMMNTLFDIQYGVVPHHPWAPIVA